MSNATHPGKDTSAFPFAFATRSVSHLGYDQIHAKAAPDDNDNSEANATALAASRQQRERRLLLRYKPHVRLGKVQLLKRPSRFIRSQPESDADCRGGLRTTTISIPDVDSKDIPIAKQTKSPKGISSGSTGGVTGEEKWDNRMGANSISQCRHDRLSIHRAHQHPRHGGGCDGLYYGLWKSVILMENCDECE
jgi:hypothetical protein